MSNFCAEDHVTRIRAFVEMAEDALADARDDNWTDCHTKADVALEAARRHLDMLDALRGWQFARELDDGAGGGS